MSRIALADTVRRVRPLAPLRPFVPNPDRADVWWDASAEATDSSLREFTADDFAASLTEWVRLTEPPICHGHATAVGHPEIETGRVVGVLRLSENEAKELGIESQSGDWLYAECACLPSLAELIDSQQLRGTSPGLQSSYLDDEGRLWPVILRELSFVREPRLRTQPRAAEIDAANLGDIMLAPAFTRRLRAARTITIAKRDGTVLYDGALAGCRMADLPGGEPVTVTEGDESIAMTTPEELATAMSEEAVMEEGGDLVEALTAALETLDGELKEKARELLDMLTAAAGAGGMAAEIAAEMSDKSPKGELAALRNQVALLKAERSVDTDLLGKVLPVGVGRDKLLECHMRDPIAYAIALSALPNRPRLATERINLGDQRPAANAGEAAAMADMTVAAAVAQSRGQRFDPVDYSRYGAGGQ